MNGFSERVIILNQGISNKDQTEGGIDVNINFFSCPIFRCPDRGSASQVHDSITRNVGTSISFSIVYISTLGSLRIKCSQHRVRTVYGSWAKIWSFTCHKDYEISTWLDKNNNTQAHNVWLLEEFFRFYREGKGLHPFCEIPWPIDILCISFQDCTQQIIPSECIHCIGLSKEIDIFGNHSKNLRCHKILKGNEKTHLWHIESNQLKNKFSCCWGT